LGKIQYGGALSLFKTDDTLKEDAIEWSEVRALQTVIKLKLPHVPLEEKWFNA
jgi:hypothetical protein